MSKKKIEFKLKEKLISLAGTCFWYWDSFYSFLNSCEVPKSLWDRYPKGTYTKYQVMRNVLERLEENNEIDIINNIISNFFRLNNAVDRDNLDTNKAKNMLNEFKYIVGNDPIENAIRKEKEEESKRKYRTSIEELKYKKDQLEKLNTSFSKLTTGTGVTPQQRGYAFEKLFCDLLQLEEFDFSRPYKTPNGEQIDGHFKYEKFDYLIEAKWTDGVTKQTELSIFNGKIQGKAQSTRGLFLSANGFDENAVTKFSVDSPRIILMTGEDIAIILSGKVSLYDALKAKVDAIVRYGNINYPLKQI